jgi:hypothetical protein
MGVPQPGKPTNTYISDELRSLMQRPPSRPSAAIPAMPTQADYMKIINDSMGADEDDITSVLSQLTGETGQANDAAAFARQALTAGMAGPIPQLQRPNMPMIQAFGTLLGDTMGDMYMRQPHSGDAFNTIRQGQETERALALQKRQENLANLRSTAERLAAHAEKMGDLETALKYQHKIETIDRQRASMAEAGVHALDAQSADRTGARNTAANMYGSELAYSASMNNAVLDFLKPTGGSGSGNDKSLMDPSNWDKELQGVLRDIGALVSAKYSAVDTRKLATSRYLALPPRPVLDAGTGQYRRETPQEYYDRMTRPGGYIDGSSPIINPKDKNASAALDHAMWVQYPQEMYSAQVAALEKEKKVHDTAVAAAEERRRQWTEAAAKATVMEERKIAKAGGAPKYRMVGGYGFGLNSGRR